MGQPAQDLALTLESLLAASVEERDAQKLDRHLALKTPVISFGEPNAAHSALTNRRYQRIGADGAARKCRLAKQRGGMSFKKSFFCQRVVLVE
jgi:hypothetical protein